MPTGYTDAIAKGISFRDFVLRCARGMGACIMQRDEPMSEPPKTQTPSDYHEKELKKAETELKELKDISDETALHKARSEHEKQRAEIEAGIRNNIDLKAKYEAMLSRVQKWNPPTPEHVGLKDFMINQINESIRFDCEGSYYDDLLTRLKPPSAEKWKTRKFKEILRNISYHKEELAKEIERTNGRNKWIECLYDSLPEVEVRPVRKGKR